MFNSHVIKFIKLISLITYMLRNKIYTRPSVISQLCRGKFTSLWHAEVPGDSPKWHVTGYFYMSPGTSACHCQYCRWCSRGFRGTLKWAQWCQDAPAPRTAARLIIIIIAVETFRTDLSKQRLQSRPIIFFSNWVGFVLGHFYKCIYFYFCTSGCL